MDIKKIAITFGVMVIIVGCTSMPVSVIPTEDANIQAVTSTPPGLYKFTIATGIVNSDWHEEGNGLSVEINSQIPVISSSVKETKSLMENVDLLTSGKTGIAFVYDYHVILANQGGLMSAFPDAPIEKIVIKCGTEMTRPMFPNYAEAARIILPLYEEQLYIVVSDASGITSVTELKGKHVSTGEPGSATEQQARFVTNSLGIDWNIDILHERFDLTTAIESLKNGKIDAFFLSIRTPNVKLAELLKPDMPFKLIPIDGDDAKKILQANPAIFHPSKIPAGIYSTVQEDVSTLATTVVLAAMEDFPEEHTTQILELFFNKSSASWKNRLAITPESSIALLNAEAYIYLHQGTLDYFNEQGVLK